MNYVSAFVVFAVNMKTIEQYNDPLHRKNDGKDYTDNGDSYQQKAGQKAEDKWKVVGKDNKHNCRTALTRQTVIEPEVTSQTKSRKKRSRRNRDRAASAVTLDYRSTSCSAVREESGDCPKNRISETKSFHTSDKVTSKEKPAKGICKQLSHAKSNHPKDAFSCRSSAGDHGREGMTRKVAKDEVKPASVTKIDELRQPTVASICPGDTLLIYIQS